MTYEVIKIAHLIGASVLFGTGMGIAFFMAMAWHSKSVEAMAVTGGHVVIADAIFTAVAVAVQPMTGAALIIVRGYAWSELWVWGSLALYVFVGLCWLPVVWLQMQMRDMARHSLANTIPLDPRYQKYFRIWFALGWPAFLAVIGIFALMVIRPV